MTSALVGAVLVGAGLSLVLAVLIFWVNRRFPEARGDSLVETINDRLPQTQCAQCGHPGCRPYAQAIAEGAPLNLCPPGGEALVVELEQLLGRRSPPLSETSAVLLAQIDASACIGCALCLPPCPVDAIVGAKGYLHGVLSDHCTGCELCVAPCPVDCITMVPARAAAT